jgi:hypothetical protein
MTGLETPLNTLYLVAVTSSVGVVISCLEMLTLHHEFSPTGLFSWDVQRIRSSWFRNGILFPLYDRIFAYPAILLVIAARLTGALLIPFGYGNHFRFWAGCIIVGVTSLLLAVRGTDGRNGSDQMTAVTFVSLALSLSSNSSFVWKVELFFLSAQLCLSYLTSGILKIREKGWRTGCYLTLALRTRAYGKRSIWNVLRNYPRLALVTSNGVILFECSFALAMILPVKYSWPILVSGVLFHASNAAVIGLNTFFWAYIALYPAVIWCSQVYHR